MLDVKAMKYVKTNDLDSFADLYHPAGVAILFHRGIPTYYGRRGDTECLYANGKKLFSVRIALILNKTDFFHFEKFRVRT